MRESQYIESYLAENKSRGIGMGLTIGSFLAYKRVAKSFAGKYGNALEAALKRRVKNGLVFQGRSKLGGIAYYDASMEATAEKPADVIIAQPASTTE